MKQNAINTYGYAVFSCGKMPLHIVEIKHKLVTSFSVFSNAATAREYILKEKASLEKYCPLEYDPDFSFNRTLLDNYTKNGNAGLFSKVENKQIYKTAV